MSAQRSRLSSLVVLAVFAVASFFSAAGVQAQTSAAALSGIVADQSGARLPGAKVLLVNQDTRDNRSTVANSNGNYNFSGVAPGTYTLTVKAKGFQTYVEKDISLHPGDSSELPQVQLNIGAEDVTVTVTAHDVIAADGEVSSLITAEDIKHLATEGRDVTELVKILPGFALQPGGSSNGGMSNVAPDNEVVGPGGSLGNYAANGTPSNGIGLISDGANVQDPGAGGATTQSINMDMVEEVKVSTSNFGADTAKGPVVINAVGKAGGQNYHGSVYIIARTYQLNAQDWFVKNQGLPKPQDRYLYPGGTIGGPIRIPGTHFNDSKKWLFLIGGEDYVQRNAFLGGSGGSALKLSTVPTDAMRGGDFSNASLANLFNVAPADLKANCNNNNPNGTLYVFINFCQELTGYTPKGNSVTNGTFNPADIDPGAAVYLNKLIPHQNRIAQPVAGTNQESDGYDRSDLYLTNYDLYQVRGRIDYNHSQTSKFYAVYNVERGYSYSPFTLYGGLTYVSGVVRDPSLIKSGVNSQTASGNYVTIFGPTLTAETFVAASYYFNNFNPVNESAQTAATLGYPYGSFAPNGSLQIPQLGYGNNSGIPLYQGPDFSFGQSFSRKISLDGGENVTKVFRQHTIKLGLYLERVSNNQLTAGSPTQGSISEYGTYGAFPYPTTGGAYATSLPNNTIGNLFFGNVNSYTQQTSNPIVDMFYNVIDGYATDSYKVTKRITLDYGIRFDHLGPWTDPHNIGPAFWYPSKYFTPANSYGPTCIPPNKLNCSIGVGRNALPGLDWHGKDSTVSNSVQPGRWAFVSPRVGFAFDAYGKGRTVFTGGAGLYRSHDSWNDYVSTLGTALGAYAINFGTGSTLACIDASGKGQLAIAAIPGCAGPNANGSGSLLTAQSYPSITAADPTDDQQPLTITYSFGVNQALPKAGNLMINYVGNQSSNLLLNGGYAGNVNTIPLGGLFAPDPNPLSPAYQQIAYAPDGIGQNGNGGLTDDYRPFPFYNGINVVRHALSSNYNSLQVTWSKWSGKVHYNLNYTWSKALGYRNGPDGTNSRNDYGIMNFDRTNAFNASYTYTEGRAFHVNRFVGGVVNNWEVSGITNLQSGPNIPASYGSNFQLTSIINLAPGAARSNVDSATYLGTPDIALQPIITCDPSKNLKKDQFINSSCLTLGQQGVNGPFQYPYLRGPAFFNSDLSAQKGFRFEGKKELVLRFSAFNFINHPLTSLVASTSQPLRLVIVGPGGQANSTFGISAYKQGRRVSEVTVRFNF